MKNNGNQPKTMKKHGNQSKTMIEKRNVTNTGPQLTSMIKKRDVTNTGPNRPFRCLDYITPIYKIRLPFLEQQDEDLVWR